MTTLRSSYLFDAALETQDAPASAAYLGARLRAALRHAYDHAPRLKAQWDGLGVKPDAVQSPADLHLLPVTRKDELASIQSTALPFGGLNSVAVEKMARVFISPGNIYDPQGAAADFWRFAPALAAAGFRAGDLVLNTFSYHMTPAGFMFDGALRHLGCVVVPTGVGQTEQQVRIASDLAVTGFVGTPSFLYTLLTKARELNTPLKIEVAFVTAEMLPPSLRAELENDFGIRVLQGYGTADLGMLAYECPQKDGMHLHPECIVEILDLETRQPAEPGQPGEVVATIFDEAYPLIRFATGDVSSWSNPTACSCGRTAPKLSGILGRVGDAVKVKGLFIRGSQMDSVIKQFPEVAKYQAIVTRDQHQDQLRYVVELARGMPGDALPERLAEALRSELKVRGEVEIVAFGSLPQGAKKIDDRRVWK
ncbi:MAG: AMP-binding protein [Burkholderiales bacterium]